MAERLSSKCKALGSVSIAAMKREGGKTRSEACGSTHTVAASLTLNKLRLTSSLYTLWPLLSAPG